MQKIGTLLIELSEQGVIDDSVSLDWHHGQFHGYSLCFKVRQGKPGIAFERKRRAEEPAFSHFPGLSLKDRLPLM